ncbi:hypothetical protein GCM10023084_74790 [Streptomyces lacrimifluminis]|uniref:Uncharacterized protein n=1 Tax=Streptomyces lacrimifluminis TaxID=1500077 RepID=A0A917UL11_9ACTN|nr:hypothetical protein GCM10012282_72870 [Streptomyces lacrimifluminis]
MQAEVVVALIAGGAGLAVAVASVPLNYALARRVRREDEQDLMARYRDPFLWAMHDLRSRIRTILDDEFLTRFLINGEDAIPTSVDFMNVYARRHTVFVLAEYLGWVEIVRRTVGFLDLGDQRMNRSLLEYLTTIRRVLFAVDLDPIFHVPTGQQRAIGELMIVPERDGERRNWRCIGFAEFCARLDRDEYFAGWFKRVDQGVVNFASQAPGSNRLVELNMRLTELIDFLDPSQTRFPLRDQERPHYRSQE